MDEEEELTNQLEAEQQQALQTAIEEEESWLKELAREENTVIDVETETETENELGVSSVWDCLRMNWEWVFWVGSRSEKKREDSLLSYT